MKILVTISLILYCLSGSVIANENDHWNADLLLGISDVTVKKYRLRIARGLRKEVYAIKAYVPSLTPDQEKWLALEKEALASTKGDAFNSKSNAYYNSNEFQLSLLNDGLDRIVKALDCILEEKSSFNQELLCWAYANWALTDSDILSDAINQLNHRNAVDFSAKIRKQFNLTYSDEDPWGSYNMFGRAIQQNIVLPLIRMGEK